MEEKIKAFLISRNLKYTLKNTVDFLKKEPRVEINILDNDTTYGPTLDYYDEVRDSVNIHHVGENAGPYVLWHRFSNLWNDNYFIAADTDCTYDGIPEDWLDKMIHVLKNSDYVKAGFSLRVDDLPNTGVGNEARNWDGGFWTQYNEKFDGWHADTDTTFALYKPRTGMCLGPALRLNKPYTMRHEPWYLDANNVSEEWRYYHNNISGASYWGNRLRAHGVFN